MTHHTVAHPPIMNHNFSMPLPPPPAVYSPMHGPHPMPVGQIHTHLGIPGLSTPSAAPPPVVPTPAPTGAPGIPGAVPLPSPGLTNPGVIHYHYGPKPPPE